jgi:purine-binding chemotaxis protein CheW
MKPARKQCEPLDPRQLRERLARAVAATEASLQLSPEQAARVLQERAAALARPALPPTGDRVLEVVVFSLADENHALESRHVREVVRFVGCTPVPGGPDFLVGVINLRGDVLAVFDLRRFFGVESSPAGDFTRVVVLGEDRAEFGVLADAVREIQIIRTEEILEAPGSVAGAGRDWLRGVTRDALVILDGAALLRDRRLVIDQADETTAMRGDEP